MGVLPHVSKQVCWDKHLELSGGWLSGMAPDGPREVDEKG